MSEKTLFRVAVNCEDCDMGSHCVRIIVAAEDGHEALDMATEHSNAKELYDEEIQRAIVDGEISESRIERKYSGYVEEIEYAGDLE
jgi:hypothetical protein